MARESRPETTDEADRALAQLNPAVLNERLLNAILSISRCATLDEALEPLLDAALDVTQMDGGGVYWVEDDVAVLRHHRGLPEAFVREVTRMSLMWPPVQALWVLVHEIESLFGRLYNEKTLRESEQRYRSL
jgi:hypothetical protein